jgi:hypothetical protein
MGMLDRIKKRQYDGFKEFVLNMETTGSFSRQQIFMTGILEDAVFMTYVMKNVRTFDDFLNLPSDEIEAVIRHQDQVMGVMAKCVHGLSNEKIMSLESTIPKHMSKLKDELSYLQEVTPSEKEGARYFIMKIARKLQMQESINGFKWQLPPQELFHPKILKDSYQKIYFESGVLAAEGEIVKGKRCGLWKHYYDSGKLLAEGEYADGLKNAVWVFYYGNSNIKSQGKYKADLKQGVWKEWDRAGQLSESEFHEGVKKAAG